MKISVSPRSASDSKFKMRKMGLIPGIIFSKSQNDMIMMSEKEFKRMRQSHDPLMETEDGALIVLKEVQRDPVSQKPIHVTFQSINKNQTFTVEIPIYLDNGDTSFSSQGKILKTLKTSVKVKTNAQAVVDHLTVDVANLEANHVLCLKDITLPQGMELLEDGNLQVCVVNYLKIEEEPEVTKPSLSPAAVPLITKDKPVKETFDPATAPSAEVTKTSAKAPIKA
jgi:large subunit ribosomal protein L25